MLSFSRAVRHSLYFPYSTLLTEAIAGRLSAADSDLRILVLEGGSLTYNNPAHGQPARFFLYLHRVRAVHVSRPSAVLGDLSVLVPCVPCLGGESVNCTSVSPFSGRTEGQMKIEMADCHWEDVCRNFTLYLI